LQQTNKPFGFLAGNGLPVFEQRVVRNTH
jgi:hypothetical protein